MKQSGEGRGGLLEIEKMLALFSAVLDGCVPAKDRRKSGAANGFNLWIKNSEVHYVNSNKASSTFAR
jgi:hypothetical protein